MPTTTPEQQQQYIMSLERTSSWHDILDTPAFDLEEGRSSSSDDDNYRYVDPANRKFRKPPSQFFALMGTLKRKHATRAPSLKVSLSSSWIRLLLLNISSLYLKEQVILALPCDQLE